MLDKTTLTQLSYETQQPRAKQPQSQHTESLTFLGLSIQITKDSSCEAVTWILQCIFSPGNDVTSSC